MKLLKLISIADIFTLTNGLIGMLAIMYIIDDNYEPAAILLFFAILMDGLDGAIARYFGSKHSFGVYLDSVADSISFCIAPAILIYTVFYDIDRGKSYEDLKNLLTFICCSFLFILGMLRLARFTYSRQNKLENYVGIPTPAITFFILCLVVIFENHIFYTLPIIIIVSLFMISDFEYPKIRGKMIIGGLIAIISGIFGVVYRGEFHNILGFIALFFIIIYFVYSPIALSRS